MAPRLEESEIKKYWEIFNGLSPIDGKLPGDRVSPVLKNSGLKDDQLGRIWELSDIDSDGKLDFEEFCITMKLIFDLVNGDIREIPQQLPDWLVPASKSHIIQANRALKNNGNDYTYNSDNDDDDDDDSAGLSGDFDWYISPTDKSTYETIYNSNSDHLGRVRFDSLGGLYSTLNNVPETDVSSAWNLVNPKSFETIDKDQCLVFLHILNQRENNKRVPRSVPASLRATFSKEIPNYDLNSHQGDFQKAQPSGISTTAQSQPKISRKQSFGDNYLSRIGGSNKTVSNGTDFSSTKGTDWEEVRLRRELQDLEDLIAKAEKESNTPKDASNDKVKLIKYEFEELLKYKESKLDPQTESNNKDLDSIKSDIELIESQVETLENFLVNKQSELSNLQQEIQRAKA